MDPPAYERELRMPRGWAPSFSGSPLRALLGRRDRELTRYETPVAGLFLTGAATYPGAGIWGASGRNAADRVVTAARPSPPPVPAQSRGLTVSDQRAIWSSHCS